MKIYIKGKLIDPKARLKTVREAILALPHPQITLYGESGYEQYNVADSVFIETGEAAFLSRQCPRFLCSLGTTSCLQIFIWNDQGECFHSQLNAGYDSRWGRVFSLFTHSSHLKMNIIGGIEDETSIGNLNSLILSLMDHLSMTENSGDISLTISHQLLLANNSLFLNPAAYRDRYLKAIRLAHKNELIREDRFSDEISRTTFLTNVAHAPDGSLYEITPSRYKTVPPKPSVARMGRDFLGYVVQRFSHLAPHRTTTFVINR